MKVFTLIDCYLPGYKHGGPIQTVANMVARMPGQFEFWIFTRDRDRGDERPYPQVKVDAWNTHDRAHVYYSSPRGESIVSIAREIREARPDVVYANSLFSRMTIRYLVARRLGLVPRHPFILAPRGELSAGALKLKYYKKGPFLAVAARLGLLDSLVWQASTDLEKSDIVAALHPAQILVSRNICVAKDLAVKTGLLSPAATKEAGRARLVFLSRVSRKKNLLMAIDLLRALKGEVGFDIYGPIDDPGYWKTCEQRIARLPGNVSVNYRGSVEHHEVSRVFGRYDFFLFPTLSENFGHVIFEALTAGCPAIISDTTAWRNLEDQGAGWDLPLNARERWSAVLQECIDMGPERHTMLQVGARTAGLAFGDDPATLCHTVKMFEYAITIHRVREQERVHLRDREGGCA
jgi:glycosyltransferase involved in cell wall biosynthesis